MRRITRTAPDAGAASVTDALARFSTALTQGDAAELCRLIARVGPRRDPPAAAAATRRAVVQAELGSRRLGSRVVGGGA
jgi:hypothetical protein